MKHRDANVEKVTDTIHHHTTRKVTIPGPDGTPDRMSPAIDVLMHRARTFLKVASSVSSRADGFPSTAPGNGNPGGGKGGRKLMSVPVEDAGRIVDFDLVPTSSTEVAALDARHQTDPITSVGREVWQLLTTVARSLDQLEHALNRAERLQSTAQVPDPPMCWVAQVKYKLPWDIAWEPYRSTDFAGVLDQPFDEPRKVSSFVYWYTRRTHQLPEKADMLAYLSGKAKVHE